MPESPSPVAVYLYASYLIKIQAGLHSSRRCHGQDRRSPETPPATPRQRLVRTLQREGLYGRVDGHARNESLMKASCATSSPAARSPVSPCRNRTSAG